MIAADVQTRSEKAGEHLRLLRSLAIELERAMQAIADNDLPELEDSIANQQSLSSTLSILAEELRGSAPANRSTPAQSIDGELMGQIHAASAELQKLNLRYSILLQHSSRSVAMMVSLFRSFTGQLQEASGAGLKHQTWSCQI